MQEFTSVVEEEARDCDVTEFLASRLNKHARKYRDLAETLWTLRCECLSNGLMQDSHRIEPCARMTPEISKEYLPKFGTKTILRNWSVHIKNVHVFGTYEAHSIATGMPLWCSVDILSRKVRDIQKGNHKKLRNLRSSSAKENEFGMFNQGASPNPNPSGCNFISPLSFWRTQWNHDAPS